MSDTLKAVNPFLHRIPTELHEQFMADLLTELMELNMAETSNYTDDGALSVKYVLMFAFARKI
jgi:prolipoprotein diacylglyceryltransferase